MDNCVFTDESRTYCHTADRVSRRKLTFTYFCYIFIKPCLVKHRLPCHEHLSNISCLVVRRSSRHALWQRPASDNIIIAFISAVAQTLPAWPLLTDRYSWATVSHLCRCKVTSHSFILNMWLHIRQADNNIMCNVTPWR